MTDPLRFAVAIPHATSPARMEAQAVLVEDDQALLVTEIHHRVMNSYQVISALAQRCGRIREIDELPPVLDDLADRLTAFAAVHRQLATPPSGRLSEYCSTLGANLIAAFGRSDTLYVGVDAVDLPQRQLAKIALIIAELLTNCLKHSLVSVASGSIYLDLRVSGDRLLIEAQDSAAAPVSHPAPLPSRVVTALSASLGGDACVVDRQGYCAQVTLPVRSPEGLIRRRRRDTETTRPSAPSHRIVARGPAREVASAHL